MKALLLRLEAPLMAFGGPMVDARGPTLPFPGLAMLTGLLGNALGWHHGDAVLLNDLQARLRFATVQVRPGRLVADYQTVDLGQPHLGGTHGWTTRGRLEARGGGSSSGTHIRQRQHLADALLLVALRLEPEDTAPTPERLAQALERPARPLFLGRKPCLPSSPILLRGACPVASLGEALLQGLAILDEAGHMVELPIDEPPEPLLLEDEGELVTLVDARDWRNQIHGGERQVRRARFARPAAGRAVA